MEVNYLINTNIFLEILSNQEKNELCKTYLNQKLGHIFISDFSLHSIGVILFRNKKFNLYRTFLKDVLPKIKLAILQPGNYNKVADLAGQFSLDFDDAYQIAVAEQLNLTVTTMDNDFKKVSRFQNIDFISEIQA